MAVEPTSKAKLVSSHQLSQAVEEAVKAASQRNHSAASGLGGHNILARPDILGRMIRDLEQARHFSESVAAGLGKTGTHVDPVVISLGSGGHLAGFVERDSLQIREF
jgi:hypothetical protein